MKNKKHKLFADEYLSNGMNATEAYHTVYKPAKRTTSETNGQKLLHNTAIAAYIKKEQDKMSKKLGKTREDIITDLTDIIDEYKLSGKLTGNTLKAIEILNKMCGWYEVEKSEITIKTEQPLFGPEDTNKDVE